MKREWPKSFKEHYEDVKTREIVVALLFFPKTTIDCVSAIKASEIPGVVTESRNLRLRCRTEVPR